MRAALIVLALLCAGTAAGCGGAQRGTATTAAATTTAARTGTAADGLRIGVVGAITFAVAGAVPDPGPLEQVAGDPLVLVSAEATDLETLAAVAAAHPVAHFALVGASTKGHRLPNLVGLVLDDAEAARLGGIVAGLVASEQGGLEARVAWVGPQERALAGAFARGAQDAQPRTTVLRAWSRDLPAACKEAALGAIARGAVAVMAHGGPCADAAVAGAHQQNRVGLRISDFELADVPVSVLVRDAVAGVYRGGEDIVFGPSSGAIGIRALDRRISPDIAARARATAQELSSGLRPSG